MRPHVFSPSLEQFRSIPLEWLDFPDAIITALYQEVDPHILTHVDKYGLLQPLPVHQVAEQSCHMLAGYAYLPVLRQLGYTDVVCQVMTGFSEFSRSVFQIDHCLSTIQASPILQAHLLNLASQSLDEGEIMQLLPLMGYKPQQYKVQELLALLNLSPGAILALHRGHLSPKTGKLLSKLTPNDQETLVGIIETYRPGGSKQQKLVETLIELSLRNDQPIATLVAPLMEAQEEEKRPNLPQQFQRLLQFLHEQSAPHLTGAEKQFQRLAQELDLPGFVQLIHSTSFEDESVELRIQCEDVHSLKKLWTNLSPHLDTSPGRQERN